MSIDIVGRRLSAASARRGQAADLADEAAGEGDEVARREAVGGLLGSTAASPSAAGDTT